MSDELNKFPDHFGVVPNCVKVKSEFNYKHLS